MWNEVWLTRPDLPKGFGGWQVLDPTPSVKSNGDYVFHLGPAPRHAVKLGQRMKYDVEYVISEVCYYRRHIQITSMKLLCQQHNSILGIYIDLEMQHYTVSWK